MLNQHDDNTQWNFCASLCLNLYSTCFQGACRVLYAPWYHIQPSTLHVKIGVSNLLWGEALQTCTRFNTLVWFDYMYIYVPIYFLYLYIYIYIYMYTYIYIYVHLYIYIYTYVYIYIYILCFNIYTPTYLLLDIQTYIYIWHIWGCLYTQLWSQNKLYIIMRMDMHPRNYSYLYIHVVSLNNP